MGESEIGSRKSEASGSGHPWESSDSGDSESVVVLFVGGCDHDEFRPALTTLGSQCRLAMRVDVATALDWLRASEQSPALIVLAQARPGQIAAEDVDRLRAAAPLARFAALLGSWCEGETRTGKPWPGVVRVYWHQWTRLAPEIAALQAGRASAWSLPATASDEERLLWSASQDDLKQQGLAAIVSDDFALAHCLIDACRLRGLAAVWFSRERLGALQGADYLLWDVASDGEATDELERAAAAFPQSRIFVLANFPRGEDQRRWQSAGAEAVLAKPLLLADLFARLEKASPQDAPAARGR